MLSLSYPYQGGYVMTQGYHSGHPAIDWALPLGTPLYAAHAGQVVRAGADGTGYGYVICIKSDTLNLYTVYGHINYTQSIAVRVGQWVSEREYIGRSGNTGNSTGPHLHMELRQRPYAYPGSCINPLPYLHPWSDTPPTPSGDRWRTTRVISIYAAASIGAQVVGKLGGGAVVTASVYPDRDPLRDWLALSDGRYIMQRNKAKTLAVRV